MRLQLLAAAFVCLLSSGPAMAQAVTAEAAGSELVDAFLDLCLNRFPDDAAFAEGAQVRRLAALPPPVVRHYLHDDPGRGWTGTAPSGQYVVTIEEPPYHACAVRGVFKPALEFQSVYQLVLGLWASNHGVGPLRAAPPVHRTVDGAVLNGMVQAVVTSAGQVEQTFMLIVTTYGNGQTEVRLARQKFSPP